MAATSRAGTAREAQPAGRRRYDSPVRRQGAADTRKRIVSAGVAVVHALPDWDWSGLTFRAVASGAGVSESTVYRHFANERELHNAVMHRLHEFAGVDYSTVTLDNLGDVGGQVFESMASFAAARWGVEVEDPTISGIDQVRRRGLLAAVQDGSAGLSLGEQHAVAGVLDVLWSPTAYERLVAQWGMSPEQAKRAIQWVIGLVVAELRSTAGEDDERRH
jgi:AcrR family transcriptional regulator